MEIRELLRKLQLLISVALAVFPAHWIAAAWLDGALVGVCWLFSLGVVLAGGAALFVPGKLRLPFAALICLAVLGGTLLLIPGDLRFCAVVQLILFALQLFFCLQIAGWDRTVEIPALVLGFGVAAHLVGQILLFTDWAGNYPGWMLRLTLYGFVFFAILSVNRRTLVTAYGKWGKVPLSLGRRNSLLVIGLFLLSLFGGLIPSGAGLLREWIRQGLQWLGGQIASLLSAMGKASSSTAAGDSGSVVPPVGGGQALEMSPFMEKIVMFVGAVLSLGLVLFVLWHIIRKLAAAFRDGLGLFGKFLSGASEDYVDEVSDTRENGEASHLIRRSRRMKRYREDPSLPPQEQIRGRYRYLKASHTEWAPGATAREKLPETAAAIYEKTRYSSHAPTPEDARSFSEYLRDM